jgi:hypothetical protein
LWAVSLPQLLIGNTESRGQQRAAQMRNTADELEHNTKIIGDRALEILKDFEYQADTASPSVGYRAWFTTDFGRRA